MNIVAIAHNERSLYEGNLRHYVRTVFTYGRHLYNPYHNLDHTLFVTELCYDACEFYRDRLTPREMRNLLIAALFHDFDHSGRAGRDDLEVTRAVRGLRTHLLEEDVIHARAIAELIHSTEYPHRIKSVNLDLCQKILRDADSCQALEGPWLQQVVLGLAKEMGISIPEMLGRHLWFHSELTLLTSWSEERFGRKAISRVIEETNALLALLNE